jgi:hypothetical protein
MLGARWFSRAWCFHEGRAVEDTSASNPAFLCFGYNGRVLSFEFRFLIFLLTHLCAIELMSVPALEYFDNPDPTSLLQLSLRMFNFTGRKTEESSLMNLGLRVLSSKCCDLEDLVSIALNTSRLPLSFRGRVKTREDILVIFAAISIASGDVAPLVLEGTILKLPPDGGENHAVSWMERPDNWWYDEWPRPFLANTVFGVESEYIELDLYLFTNLPTMATQSSMTIAAAILAEHGLEYSFGSKFESKSRGVCVLENGPVLRGYEELCPYYGQACLALAIDCGIDWIRRFPATLTQTKTDPEPHFGSIGVPNSEIFRDVAQSLLSVLGISVENTPGDFDEEYLTPTTTFLACIADRSLRKLCSEPCRIRTAPNDSVLTTISTNQVWFAVPVAISQLPFWVDRVWMVEPFDPAEGVFSDIPPTASHVIDYTPDLGDAGSSSNADHYGFTSNCRGFRAARNDERATWRLKGKKALYGCQQIVPEGKFVSYLKRQRVYGTGMHEADGPFYYRDEQGHLGSFRWPKEG